MANFLAKIFGDPNQKELQKLQPIVDKINNLEPDLEKLSLAALKEQSLQLRKLIERTHDEQLQRALLDEKLPQAFVLVREIAKRLLSMRHFDVQLLGGVVLHQGKIAEMKTGEGKTLVATLSLYLNALTGRGAHLITPNDYLAKMGAHWMGPIYEALGVSIGVIGQQGESWCYQSQPNKSQSINPKSETNVKLTNEDWSNLVPCTRREAYHCDITYGTNNEFGFDYLRDNMALSPGQLVQRQLNYAIVDEVDSILIDEARTPLIISAAAEKSADLYYQFAQLVKTLKVDEDYEVDEKERFVKITDQGIQKTEQGLGVSNIYNLQTVALVHHLEEALKAQALFAKDRDYVVNDGEVIIVDEFTGRLMPGRRYSEGLHQAIEAKEKVEVKEESKTLATITFQNLFRLYPKLAGMTGTASTEAEEFAKIYNLEVVEIPTHRLLARIDTEDVIYKREEAKFEAIAEDVKTRIDRKQPVLIGTVSIEKSERLSKFLKKRGIKHDILNAKNHEREAKIIENAGGLGRVTVATNMAGRGVDIVLGGKKPGTSASKADFEQWEKRHSQVLEAGGLAVIGTERHESRRIDNQLRGRSGRQGDGGVSQFYISLEDDLMRIFGGERLQNLMDRLGLPDNEPIRHKLISNAIEQAQKKVEAHHFDIRKHLVEYDDVMNQHREVVYKKRRRILDLDPASDSWLHEEIMGLAREEEKNSLNHKFKNIATTNIYQIEKLIYLRTIDLLWIEHLNTMTHLRESIGLKGYAQKDPLVEYKDAAYNLFSQLKREIENQVVEMLVRLEVQTTPSAIEDETPRLGNITTNQQNSKPEYQNPKQIPNSKPQVQKSEGVQITVRGPGSSTASAQQTIQPNPYGKVGRNEPCPCGATKADGRPVKFKHCHG